MDTTSRLTLRAVALGRRGGVSGGRGLGGGARRRGLGGRLGTLLEALSIPASRFIKCASACRCESDAQTCYLV